jgi:excisionase family DNA binding protein
MTLKEAAAILGVTPDALRQAIAAGSLRAVKRGRDWWVTPEAVRVYEREHRGRPGRPKQAKEDTE